MYLVVHRRVLLNIATQALQKFECLVDSGLTRGIPYGKHMLIVYLLHEQHVIVDG